MIPFPSERAGMRCFDCQKRGWDGGSISMLASHTLYPNSGSAFKSSEWCLIHRDRRWPWKSPWIKKDTIFWWPPSCAECCRAVKNVEFCRGPLQLPQFKKKTPWLGDDHQVFTFMSDKRGPCLMDWAIGRRGIYNEWIAVILGNWQNSDVFPWPTHAYLGLGNYFSQISNHWTSLSLAYKEMCPSPHAFHQDSLIILNLQFFAWDSRTSRGQPSSVALANQLQGECQVKITWYIKINTHIKHRAQSYSSTCTCPPRQAALVIKTYLICIGATLSVKAECICR